MKVTLLTIQDDLHQRHLTSLSSSSARYLCPISPPFHLPTSSAHPRVRDYSPIIARKSFPDQEKHLRLLDAIALLLVTEEKSDVAAVMFEQTAQEVVFHYSKNRPSTAREREYLELRQLALTLPDIGECAIQLLNLTIPMCHSKIVSRLRRLNRCIPSELQISRDHDGTFRSHLVEKLPHLFPETGSLSSENIVHSSLSQVRTTDHTKCSVKTLRKLIRFVFAIGCYPLLGNLIHDETVVRRLRKIGNYYGATTDIAKTVSRLQQPNAPGYTTANVNFREVPPPKQTTTYISTDHTATLNRFGATCGFDPITSQALKAAYPCPATGENAKQSQQHVTHSVHAECTLAIHALSLRKDWSYVEIGVSKGTCWLCEQFLNQMGAVPGHGISWEAAARDSDVVAALVGNALKEIIKRVLNRRRSDSFPHAESDAEKSAGRAGFDDDLEWVMDAMVLEA